MAELSAETEAIIDRLKREGELLRNSGNNSIRSVKVELAKFEGIFNTISTNIASQTDAVRAGIGAQADIAERQAEQAARDRAFADLEADQESAELKALREKVETEKLKNELRSEKDKASGPGLFKQLMGMGTMKNLAIGAGTIAALSVGYGFLDEKTEGGLNKMVKSIATTSWDKISNALNILAEKTPLILSQMEQALTPENLERLAEKAGQAAVGALGIGAAVLAAGPVTEMIKDGVITAATLEAIRRSGGGARPPVDGADDDPDRRGRGRASGFRSLLTGRNAIIAAVGSGLVYYGSQASELFKQDSESLTKDQLMNTSVDGVEGLSTIAGAATLGSMFGIKGLIAGAILGGAYVLGKTLYHEVRDAMYDIEGLPNDIQDALKKGGTETRRRGNTKTIYNKTVEEMAEQTRERLNSEIDQAREELESIEDTPITGNNRERRIARQQRDRRKKELEEIIERREMQRQNFENLLNDRIEKGIADFDTETRGVQTLEEYNARLAREGEPDVAVTPSDRASLEERVEAENPELQRAQQGEPLKSEISSESIDRLVEAIESSAGNQAPIIVNKTENITPVNNTIIEGDRNISSSALVEMNNGGEDSAGGFAN